MNTTPNEDEGRGGDCFEVALRVAYELSRKGHADHPVNYENVCVVHGTPLGRGPHNNGKRYWHAWVEHTQHWVCHAGWITEKATTLKLESVVDRSNGLDVEMPRAMYYNMGRMREKHVLRFSTVGDHDEAMARADGHGHYGPWVDERYFDLGADGVDAWIDSRKMRDDETD